MHYIESTLGINLQYQTWNNITRMPYFITDRYEIQLVTTVTTQMLFLYPKTELEQMSTLKKHIARIQKEEPLPVVLILKNINRYRRECLINAHIPFVVADKQLYLPFLGIALQEKYIAEAPIVEQFQPSAQVLFFYYLYQRQEKIYTSKAVEMLGYSAMTITRAAKQLVQTGLFDEEKDGVQKILIGKLTRKELFDKAQPYLINPVKKRIYVRKNISIGERCLAGLTALSEISMLNPPAVMSYAVESKVKIEGTETLIDSDSQVEIELWKYNPRILSGEKTVDILSLVLSLKENLDERVEEALEELLENFWEE